ncbi:MAG TPA: acyl-ACP desaturase [Mycobacteriales bacterium]
MYSTATRTRASTESIESALRQYCRSWGPVRWRSDVEGIDVRPDPVLATALLLLAAIETDSRIIARKIRAGRVDADPYLHEFLIIWQAEESEHGRALHHLALRHGAVDPQPTRSRLGPADIVGVKAMAHSLPRSLRSTYCTLGAIQEFVALKTYLAVARVAHDPGTGTVLRKIAAQESRHMKFYLTAAHHLLDGHPLRQRVVRTLLSALWAPPGVDLLGERRFVRAFGFLLADQAYVDQVVGVDAFLGRLPGMGGMDLMRRWLQRNGATPGG